jgi:glycosyltransferase involved in cell wall biosynthesis
VVYIDIGVMVQEMAARVSKRILAVSYCFPPWLVPRSIQVKRLLNFLCSKGHVVTVFRKSLQNLNVPVDHKSAQALLPGVKVVTVREYRDGLKRKAIVKLAESFPKIPDSSSAWAFDAYQEVHNVLTEAALLITFSTPISDHIVGLLLKRAKKKIPWIACFSDPFLENPYIKLSFFERLMNSILERLIINKADRVVFVNDATRQRVMSKFGNTLFSKAHVIPHSFDAGEYPDYQNSSGKLILRYMGEFYGERTPDTFFAALQLVSKRISRIEGRLKVEIYGCSSRELERTVEDCGLKNLVELKGLVQHQESLGLMKSADVLVVIDAPAEENLFLTSKIIEYLGAQRPILAITSLRGPTADLMKEMGGIPCDFHDVHGIANLIMEFLERKKKGQLRIEIPHHVYDRYRIEVVGERYADVIRSLSVTPEAKWCL